MHQTVDVAEQAVAAHMGYLSEPEQVPEIYLYRTDDGTEEKNCAIDFKRVDVRDVEGAGVTPSLEKEGFELVRRDFPSLDFADKELVESEYFPLLIDITLEATGGIRAYVFEHLVRQRDPSTSLHRFGDRVAGSTAGALGRVHNDYSEESGQRRLDLVMASHELRVAPRKYCIVNIWRSISGIVEDAPLAFCAADTVSTRDLVAAKLHYGHRTGEIYLFRYNESHRWWYQSEMDCNDVAVFKQFDSRVSAAARWVLHSAFELPDAANAKNPRRSVEARVLVVLE